MEQQYNKLLEMFVESQVQLKLAQKENQRLNSELESITKKYKKLKEKTTKERTEKPAKKKFDRNLECFENNAKIRHIYKGDIWECYVDKSGKTPILRRNSDETYKTVSGFASNHIEVLRSQGIAHGDTPATANGWTDCEVEIDGQWVSCDDIRKQYNRSL